MFEFKHNLGKQDLADIWQGVMPEVSRVAQLSDSNNDDNVFSHSLGEKEFFHGRAVPSDVRWMIFKVKKRANYDYTQITEDSKDSLKIKSSFVNEGGVSGDIPYSYNWPYDYFSLVELVQLDVENEFTRIQAGTTNQPPPDAMDGTIQ